MGKVVYETGMDKLPDNCFDCTMYGCNLPMRKGNPDCLRKLFMKKRHRDCPLLEVEE